MEDVILMGRFGKIGLLKRPSPEDYKIMQEVMDFVGINGMENRPIGKLSGGQQQKVLLARILAKEPKILLLDEPFSNLDFKARVDILDKLCRLHKEKNLTILMVTHDMSFIPERCNRAVLMNGGRIIGDGTPEEVLNRVFLNLLMRRQREIKI
ncbi:MAG: ATP-binding cassette domain-containing protein [archaeon]|nr:ATP-binding cassette domain-containing protein [archaeon]